MCSYLVLCHASRFKLRSRKLRRWAPRLKHATPTSPKTASTWIQNQARNIGPGKAKGAKDHSLWMSHVWYVFIILSEALIQLPSSLQRTETPAWFIEVAYQHLVSLLRNGSTPIADYSTTVVGNQCPGLVMRPVTATRSRISRLAASRSLRKTSCLLRYSPCPLRNPFVLFERPPVLFGRPCGPLRGSYGYWLLGGLVLALSPVAGKRLLLGGASG